MFPFRRPSAPEITVAELEQRLKDRSVHLLDVREDWEFLDAHVPGAIHVPLRELPQRAPGLPKDRPIAVICATGHRSLAAAGFLRSHGFEGAASVAGGTKAWARSGGRLERGPGRAA